jgi:tetratricopeptide (TPR) repeat protein
MNSIHRPHYTLYLLVLIIIACTSTSKNDAANFFIKANAAFAKKDYKEAIRLYDEAIDKNKEFSDAYLNKGITLLKTGAISEAHEVLTYAIELDPTLVQANLVRAEASLQLGNYNEVEDDLKKIAKQYADSSRYFLIHGDLMAAKDNTSEAIADYDRSLVLNPSNVESLVNRGAVYYQLKQYPQAKNDFLVASRLNPAQREALNNLGLIATQEQNWTQARSYFDLVLNANPADPLALNNKGYVLLQTNELGEAGKLIMRSLDIQPKNGYALRNLGIYYEKTNDLDKAIEAYDQAIDLAEPIEMLYGLTGNLYFVRKEKDKACEIWRKGKLLNDAMAITSLGEHCR